jgi:hypothetical protein
MLWPAIDFNVVSDCVAQSKNEQPDPAARAGDLERACGSDGARTGSRSRAEDDIRTAR